MPAGQGRGKLMGTGKISTGTPTRLRSFDPVQLADKAYVDIFKLAGEAP